MSDKMIGKLIHTYRVESLLGEGGMGAVYRATDTVLERPVALKMLRSDLLSQTQFLDRFKSEAQILARLNHPNIATLYNFVLDGDDYYMVMEFVEGHTLEQWLQAHGPMPVPLAVQVIQQALEGLGHAHKRGILHRDLKPANLMVTPEGVVKLTDFGIARIMGSQRLTQVNSMVGTPAYMAPEQIVGNEPSPQSDIHALGVVLYELLSGEVPFSSTSQFETMERVMRMIPPPLRPKLDAVPSALDEILSRALSKSPTDRFADARTFQRQLATIAPYGSALDEADLAGYLAVKPSPGTLADGLTLVDSQPLKLPTLPAEDSVSIASPKPDNKEDQKPKAPLVISAPAVAAPIPPKPVAKEPVFQVVSAERTAPEVAAPAPARTVPPRVSQPELRPAGRRTNRLVLLSGVVLAVLIGLYWLGRSQGSSATVQSAGNLTLDSSQGIALSQAGANIGSNSGSSSPSTSANPAPGQAYPANSGAGATGAQTPTKPGSIRPSSQAANEGRPNRTQTASTTTDDDVPANSPGGQPHSGASSGNYSGASGSTHSAENLANNRPEPAREPLTAAADKPERPTAAGDKGRSLRLSSGTEVVVALSETVAAEGVKSGQQLALQVVKPVLVDGEVVIPQGAPVQGEVSDVSTGGKKDMIEIRIRNVRGVGGQTVKFLGATFRYIGSRNEPLVFKVGQQFIIHTAGSYRFTL